MSDKPQRTVDVNQDIPVPFGDLIAFREFFRAVNTTQALAMAGLCDARVEIWALRNPAAAVLKDQSAPVPDEVPIPVAVVVNGNRHARRATGKR